MLCDFKQNQVVSIEFEFDEKNFQIFVKSDSCGTHKAIFVSSQMLISELREKMI